MQCLAEIELVRELCKKSPGELGGPQRNSMEFGELLECLGLECLESCFYFIISMVNGKKSIQNYNNLPSYVDGIVLTTFCSTNSFQFLLLIFSHKIFQSKNFKDVF